MKLELAIHSLVHKNNFSVIDCKRESNQLPQAPLTCPIGTTFLPSNMAINARALSWVTTDSQELYPFVPIYADHWLKSC